MKATLYHGDCFDYFSTIEDQSIDLVLCDPPYGTTHCKWDSVLPLAEMWKHLERIVKPNSAILLFGRQPFTSVLVSSNLKYFRYEIIWEKSQATNFLFLKKQIGQCTENISVFYRKQPIYNPQMILTDKPIKSIGGNKSNTYNNQVFKGSSEERFCKYPLNVLRFKRDSMPQHPTQKPVALLEYLIKTYSLEGQTVLDFTMGSGSTGVACKNTNRNFIGIEKELEYFNIAKQRILSEGSTAIQVDCVGD